MIEWRAEAILIAVRSHGETSTIIDVFTCDRGRVRGLVRGGQGRKMRAVLQIGAQLHVVWKARLQTHLGHFTIEPLRARTALLHDARRLAALLAMAELSYFALPERHAYPELFTLTCEIADVLNSPSDWFDTYITWELTFLRMLGFGLDLGKCAVTQSRKNLCYISPRTGRALTEAGAGKWAPRLLPFPPELKNGIGTNMAGFAACLQVTGYFLAHHLVPSLGGKSLPPARLRLATLAESDC